MATIAEAKKRAAEKLGYAIRSALSAEWDAQMQDAYDETYSELDSMDLVTWTQSTGTVPDKLVNDFAILMAWKRADVLATSETFRRLKPESMALRDYKRAVKPAFTSVTGVTDF